MKAPLMVIPDGFNLERIVRPVIGLDNVPCLEFSSSMVTLYYQTYGELSPFFQALLNGKLIGALCPKCGMVLVPSTTFNCPDCEFEQMATLELPHRGILASTAPITIFPPAHKYGKTPYCRGYVDVAVEAKKASFMPAQLRTTTGLPRPGIFIKGIPLVLVFEDNREGRITDVFWVPKSEVSADLLNKPMLLASDLDFTDPQPPEIKLNQGMHEAYDEAWHRLVWLAEMVAKSSRAKKDIGDHECTIGIQTNGGSFGLKIKKGGELEVCYPMPDHTNFVMQTENPQVIVNWINDGSLTDAAVEGSLWLPNLQAFAMLALLDRLPRSVRRNESESKLG